MIPFVISHHESCNTWSHVTHETVLYALAVLSDTRYTPMTPFSPSLRPTATTTTSEPGTPDDATVNRLGFSTAEASSSSYQATSEPLLSPFMGMSNREWTPGNSLDLTGDSSATPTSAASPKSRVSCLRENPLTFHCIH